MSYFTRYYTNVNIYVHACRLKEILIAVPEPQGDTMKNQKAEKDDAMLVYNLTCEEIAFLVARSFEQDELAVEFNNFPETEVLQVIQEAKEAIEKQDEDSVENRVYASNTTVETWENPHDNIFASSFPTNEEQWTHTTINEQLRGVLHRYCIANAALRRELQNILPSFPHPRVIDYDVILFFLTVLSIICFGVERCIDDGVVSMYSKSGKYGRSSW